MLARMNPRPEHESAASRAEMAPPRRMVGPTGIYRSKFECEPVMPLPRWASWALVAWTIASATAYTAILRAGGNDAKPARPSVMRGPTEPRFLGPSRRPLRELFSTAHRAALGAPRKNVTRSHTVKMCGHPRAIARNVHACMIYASLPENRIVILLLVRKLRTSWPQRRFPAQHGAG